MITARPCDLFVAGPAFNAGRYGIACGEMVRRVQKDLGLPAVTGMYPENPGVDLHRKNTYIIETGNSAVAMAKAMPKMIEPGIKLFKRERIGKPAEEGYIPQGVKSNVLSDRLAAERAVELLLKKVKGLPFLTEIVFPDLDTVSPAHAITDLRTATLALVTEGGLVPVENPDNIESARASRWGKYRVDDLAPSRFHSIHRGFDVTFVNEDPNRLLPADVMKELEGEGAFKKLLSSFFVTTGVATTMENARRIGKEMARELLSEQVSGVILTST
jgi:glycine reductase